MKKKGHILLVFLVIIGMMTTNLQSLVVEAKEDIVPNEVIYNEEHTQASINFDVDSVDTSKYVIKTITSNTEDEEIYNGLQDTTNGIGYTVSENGEYSFTVTYIEKQEESDGTQTKVEKASVITKSIDGIGIMEEADSDDNSTTNEEETNTQESTDTSTTVQEETEENNSMDEEEIETSSNNQESIDTSTSNIVTNDESSSSQASSRDISYNFATIVPSQTLRKAIRSNYPDIFKDINGIVREEHLAKVISLDLSGCSLGDDELNGLQYFTSMTSLKLDNNSYIETLYFKYLPRSLMTLSLRNCTSLTKLNVFGDDSKTWYYKLDNLITLYIGSTSMTSFVSEFMEMEDFGVALPKLTTLELDNMNQLKEFDLSPATAEGYATALQTVKISSIGMKTLNLSGCTNLSSVTMDCSSLTTLNLSSTAIPSIDISNSTFIQTINLSNCTKLTSLSVSDKQYLTTLNVSNCTSLTTLTLPSNSSLTKLIANNTKISNLDLSSTLELRELIVYYTELSTLDVTQCTKLKKLEAYGKEGNVMPLGDIVFGNLDTIHTSLESINVSYTKISTLNFVTGISNTLTTLCVNNTSLTNLNVSNYTKLTTLKVSNCSSLENLNVQNTSITSLDLIGSTAITSLIVSHTSISNLDLSKLSNLTSLYGQGTTFGTIVFDGNPNITHIDLEAAKFDKLDIENLSKLETLNIGSATVSSLDVTGCIALREIKAFDTSIKELDVSECKNLQYLLVYNNTALQTLTLGTHSSLATLQAYNTEITSLNLSGCTALTELNVYNTKITSLDVSNCTNIQRIEAYGGDDTPMPLKTLTLGSSHSKLTYLDIKYTLVEELDVSHCTNLTTLYANGSSTNQMPLKTLKLGTNDELWYIYVQYTELEELDASGCSQLMRIDVSNTSLAYLKLSNNATHSSGATLTPLNTLIIEEATAKFDTTGGVYISLQNLFPNIDTSKVSNVKVDGKTVTYSNGKVYGIQSGATITYTYNTDGKNSNTGAQLYVYPTIKITTLIPTITADGVDTELDLSKKITKDELYSKYGKIKDNDNDTIYSLSEVSKHGVDVTTETYYFFNVASGKFETISVDDLLNFSKGTGIYAYEFTITEKSTSLTSTGVSRFFVSSAANNIKNSNGYIMLYDRDSITINDTQISVLGSIGNLKDFLISTLSISTFKDEGGKNITYINDKLQFDSNGLDFTNPKPNSYSVKFSILDSSTTAIELPIAMTVSENTYSYDTDGKTEINGVSGWLVIPKNIVLTKDSSNNNLTAEAEVYFANYTTATGVSFNLSVDKTFNIMNTRVSTDTITVTTSSTGSSEADKKLNLGTINNTNTKGKGKKITFSADGSNLNSTDKYSGGVTFYFERQ